jgi:hypothetical protein
MISMNALILNETEMIQLATLNTAACPDRQLVTANLKDGRHVLNADLLADSGPGQTWSEYAAFIQSLTREQPPQEALLLATDRPELIAAALVSASSDQAGA